MQMCRSTESSESVKVARVGSNERGWGVPGLILLINFHWLLQIKEIIGKCIIAITRVKSECNSKPLGKMLY